MVRTRTIKWSQERDQQQREQWNRVKFNIQYSTQQLIFILKPNAQLHRPMLVLFCISQYLLIIISIIENLCCAINKYVSNKALMLESRVITLRTILVHFALSRLWDQDAWEREQFDENKKKTINFGLGELDISLCKFPIIKIYSKLRRITEKN